MPQQNPSMGTLASYLQDNKCFLSEAEKIKRREKYLSTERVNVDLLKNTIKYNLPNSVWEEIDMTLKKINYIEDIRIKYKNRPDTNNRFPIGCTPVKDVHAFLVDIEKIENKYLNEVIEKPLTEAITMEINMLSERFVNDDFCYIRYI